MTHKLFYQSKGGTPGQVASRSHYNDPIPQDGQIHGNSRRHGDASPEVQAHVIDTIIAECHKRGMSKQDAAHVLAIARVESGFNPDAAAGTTSASGVGQFIARTGAAYGLRDDNRFDLKANVHALVDHYQDNKAMALSQGKDAAWVYKFHHDGPFRDSGGLALAQKEVLPFARAYAASPLLAELGSKRRDMGLESASGSRHSTNVAAASPERTSRRHGQRAPEASSEGIGTLAGNLRPDRSTPDSSYFVEGAAVVRAEEARPYPKDAQFATVSQHDGQAWMSQASAGTYFVEGAAAMRAEEARLYPKDAQFATVGQHDGQDWMRQASAGIYFVEGAVAMRAEAERIYPTSPVANSANGQALASTTISLGEALSVHMTEKGFDASSVAQAPLLAQQVREGAGELGARQDAALVLHKDGDALASVMAATDVAQYARPGDSVLALERIEQVALQGLDTDAVAALRGLAPEKTQPHSDLEVYQAAPASLYAMAQDPAAPLDSSVAVQGLLAGLDKLERGFGSSVQSADPDTRLAEARQEQASASMGMGA